jgi:hypothetical protein
MLDRQNDPDALTNFRSPRFDPRNSCFAVLLQQRTHGENRPERSGSGYSCEGMTTSMRCVWRWAQA